MWPGPDPLLGPQLAQKRAVLEAQHPGPPVLQPAVLRLLISDVVDVELADGCIFLLTADSKIMRLNPDGVFEGYVGIKGNGPGEYIYVNDIYLAPGGDGICLNDVMKGTITYGLDGTYKGTRERERSSTIR